MGLRAFLAGWRTVSFPRESRTAVFNAMFRACIPLAHERLRGERVSVRVREEDVRAASLVFASLGIGAEIGERHGLPAALAFCRERPGIPVGICLVALWLYFSGGLVWDIRIEGNTKTSDETILSELADLGFEIGTRWRGIDFDQLHADYVAVQNEIAWLSVYMDGTVAQVQVREMWADGVRGDRTHMGANVVAGACGVIEEVNVFEGQAAVRAGDVIRPGEVAISGILEKKDGGFRWEYAAGEVWASVAVPLSVEIPLERLEKRPTGEKKTAFALKFFKKSINLSRNYGFDPSTYDTIDTIGRVCLPDGTPLPVWVEKTVWQRTEAVPVTLSADDAQAEAMTEMRRLVREATEGGVLLEKSFRGSLRDGVWRLDGLLSVSRQIGVTEEFAVEEEKTSIGEHMAQKKITTASSEVTARLFGSFDRNVNRLESEFGVRIQNIQNQNDDGDTITIDGEEPGVGMAADALGYLRRIVTFGDELTDQSVDYIIGMVKEGRVSELSAFDDDCFFVTAKGKPIKPKTVGQKKYLELIKKNTIVLGVGPAGTGKTYLAVAAAVKALRAHEVSRIILTRPAVEAGERLGFLPGDLQSKIDPYLRPLYDALYEMLGAESCGKMIEKMTIEIAPLAYMRGRTLDDSFIILDEAQNTTPEQMKMFLTRLGNGSKAVVTGDLTQTDLPRGTKSGLSIAAQILKNIDDIGIHEFNERDVVRHRLVQKIIMAYDRYEHERAVRANERAADKRDGSREKKQYRPKRT